jgi:hypothetical protein
MVEVRLRWKDMVLAHGKDGFAGFSNTEEQ